MGRVFHNFVMSQRGKYQILKKIVVRIAISIAAATFCQAQAQEQEEPTPENVATPASETTASSEQNLRLAVVNVQELFREYYKTAETQEQLSAQRALIHKQFNDGKENARRYQKEFAVQLEKLNSPDISTDEKIELEGKLKQFSDSLHLDEYKRSQEYQKQDAELNQQMQLKMQGILDEIHTLAKIHAKNADYDMVIDISGTNTNLFPMMLFARNSENITAVLLKELNKEADAQR